jgi:hypothetical protein
MGIQAFPQLFRKADVVGQIKAHPVVSLLTGHPGIGVDSNHKGLLQF